MGRRELRESIFQLLFMTEFNDNQEMAEQKQLYLETIEDIQEKDQSYIQEKYEKIREKLPEIDAALNEASKGWKTSRMGKVELSILRLAVYELRYDDDVPGKVAINEAVELAKKFGGSEAPAFINGVLGKLAKAAGINNKILIIKITYLALTTNCPNFFILCTWPLIIYHCLFPEP